MSHQALSIPGHYITPPPPTPAEAHEAALAVCELAHDPGDARLLLDALGITTILLVHKQVTA